MGMMMPESGDAVEYKGNLADTISKPIKETVQS